MITSAVATIIHALSPLFGDGGVAAAASGAAAGAAAAGAGVAAAGALASVACARTIGAVPSADADNAVPGASAPTSPALSARSASNRFMTFSF